MATGQAGLSYGAPLGFAPCCGAALKGRDKVALGNAQGTRTIVVIGALKERHNPMPRKYSRTLAFHEPTSWQRAQVLAAKL